MRFGRVEGIVVPLAGGLAAQPHRRLTVHPETGGRIATVRDEPVPEARALHRSAPDAVRKLAPARPARSLLAARPATAA